ncbi:hypothetical protein KSP40_PGU003618 [Platanthera guangdongensis]|uniref:GRPD C-terminal domain-containing protein n=1 Tax=Platanthera guangdongensis TaxID=2320717 RepID=A0ABR2MUQ6_9ASPA
MSGHASSSPDSSAANSLSGSHRRYDGTIKGATATATASASSAEETKIRISIDLVAAARRHLAFLRSIAVSSLPHHHAAIIRSIRRYEQIWMPMMAVLSGESSSAPMLLPPPDVDWVWLCHCFDQERYREYCLSRFGTLVDRPAILDEENEEYAADLCREIWNLRHPSEPFDLEIDADNSSEAATSDSCSSSGIFAAVAKHMELHSFYSDPFVSETVYLVSARQRYLNFLHLLKKSAVESFRIVPTADIRLMWHTHQSFPGRYQADMGEMGDFWRRVVGFGDWKGTEEAAEKTMIVWEAAFDEPYERAGAAVDLTASPGRLLFNCDASASDVNGVYKSLQPRFLMEVSATSQAQEKKSIPARIVIEVMVFLKGKMEEKKFHNVSKRFLRMRTLRCHKELKLDCSNYTASPGQWKRAWHLYCEFATRGIMIEVYQHGRSCLKNNKVLKRIYFYWNDLLRSAKLTLVREIEFKVQALASVTPPVQVAYLLRSVPDCVTDDSGAMISDLILRLNHYRPQEGRWLSRTVLDHAGRECFVIRTRVGRGFWRRGGETPTAVKWEDGIVEVRVGQWSYIASSVGHAPEKVVGTATPAREDSEGRNTVWSFSTGDILTLRWEHGLCLQLQNTRSDQSVAVQPGRKQQYQVKEANPEQEQYYMTVMRSSPENPGGKATALLNWKLQAAEFSPEEDAVFVLLLNMAVLRTMSRARREDIGGLLVRHRVRQVSPGSRDWGSVLFPGGPSCDLSPHLKPWYWSNAEEALASAEDDEWRPRILKYSPADGKDELYRAGIVS